MNIHDAMPNPMLKGHDLIKAGGEKTYTIARVALEDNFVGRGKKKRQLVVYFHRETKKLGLNKTNMEAIESLYGAETENWINQPVTLFTCKVEDDINKRTIDGVRVKTKGLPPRNPNAPAPQRSSTPPAAAAKKEQQPHQPVNVKDLPPQTPELPRQKSIAEQLVDAKRTAWNHWVDRCTPEDVTDPPTKEELDAMAESFKFHVKAKFDKDLGGLSIIELQTLVRTGFQAIDPNASPISDTPQVNVDDIPF